MVRSTHLSCTSSFHLLQAGRNDNELVHDKKEIKYLRAFQRGWVKGRDEAWKITDKKRYIREAYLLRIAEIRQEYPASGIEKSNGISEEPVHYTCSQDSVTAYFIQTRLPAIVVYHNDQPSILELTESGSGAKYVRDYADSRTTFWTKGEEAIFTTSKAFELHCQETRD